MKTKLYLLIAAFLLGTYQNIMAQCNATITHTGHNCIGDTLKYIAANDMLIEWQNGSHTIRTIKPTQAPTYGITVAGNKNDSAGTDSTHLYYPADIFVDKKGNVYVADNWNNRIVKWAPGATYGVTVAGNKNGVAGKDSAHLIYPTNVFVDNHNNVYVIEYNVGRVFKWAPGAKYGTIVAGSRDSTFHTDSAHINLPTGIFVDSAGNVYVVDEGARVQMWAPGAKYGITVAGQKDCSSGSDSAHLLGASGLFVDRKGTVYVSDADNNRVQKWVRGAKYGITVAGDKKGAHGSDSAHLYFPTGVIVDSLGAVYVADEINNRVQKWAKGAQYGITVAGQKSCASGKDSAHFNQDYGIGMDADGSLYLSDQINHRVMKWAYSIPKGTVDLKTDSSGSYTAYIKSVKGCVSKSNTINIYNCAKATDDLNDAGMALVIYPNPATTGFTLHVTTHTTGTKAYLQILNTLGQVVYMQLVDNVNGKIDATINNNNMATGLYLVKVVVGNGSCVQKLVIKK